MIKTNKMNDARGRRVDGGKLPHLAGYLEGEATALL
jgi:hypothetical protein